LSSLVAKSTPTSLPKADFDPLKLSSDVRESVVRTRAVRLLHSTLELPEAAERLEAALHLAHAGGDKYLAYVNKFTFTLKKQEMGGLRKRIIMNEEDLESVIKGIAV